MVDGEGDAGEGEANFASKKASKHFKTTIYIKFHLMHLQDILNTQDILNFS